MPSPISISGCNTGMGERSTFEKGWASVGAGASTGRERVEHGGRYTGENNGLDSQLWHACAGAMVHLPQIGAKVIYFPQGHAEHAASPPEFPPSITIASTVLCRVLSVNFLADTETDEVYARIHLQPDTAVDLTDDMPPSPPLPEKTASFAKTLTQSDANNGGGFSVPRYCAETIFPRLDYSEDPPVQIVLAKDVHGVVWRFRHIYRGTPRRHLLTTGWSSFVNQKKLVAGDAIVFLRSASGELCVGVRRSTRAGSVGMGAIDSSSWHISGFTSPQSASRWEPKSSDSPYDFFSTCRDGSMRASKPSADTIVGMTNFARNRARVTASAVLEAASLAASGKPFEVVYYPRATISEFCVKANAVKTSLQQKWAPGMRFKMAVETEDASRISWFMGTIAKVQEADTLHWRNSPWKMLQVTWDEPDLLQGITRVSPWQVELVSSMQLPPFSLPKKKMRLLQPPEFQYDGQGIMGFSPMAAAFASNLQGHTNPWHGFTADSVSVGMQGARQDRSFALTLSDFRPSHVQPCLFWENFDHHKDYTNTGSGQVVSTNLSMSNFATEGSSSTSLSTLLSVGSSNSEPTFISNGSSSNKDVHLKTKSTPFLLFGKAIDTSQALRSPPAQVHGGSVLDRERHETFSSGNGTEALGQKGSFVLSQVSHSCQKEAFDSALSSEMSNVNWFKVPASSVDTGKVGDMHDNSFNHCKVFRESDDVGRTVDLSMFDSYEELFEKLSLMFGVLKAEIPNRVVCLDLMGTTGPVGEEPYRDFTKRAKRLKIISESSSESFTR